MQLEHHFTVPVPADKAWDVLLDVERIAPCMPGATVQSFDGETVDGRVKVKVGPIQVTYAGTAKFVQKDAEARRAVIEANAKEARGAGTAAATITTVLIDTGGTTDVTVITDLQITGKPAQFGRGVMVEVGNKLLGQFADCLAAELGGGRPPGAPVGAAETPAAAGEAAAAAREIAASTTIGGPQATTAPPPLRTVRESEPIDLLETAGLPVLKRLAPVLGAVILLIVIWRLLGRRRD